MDGDNSTYECGDLFSGSDTEGLQPNLTMANNCTQALPPSGDTDGPTNEMRFIFETGLTLPIATLGILGNILAATVLLRHHQRHSTIVLMQCLAVTDALILLAAILLRSIRYLAIYYDILQGYMAAYPYIFLVVYPIVYFLRLTVMWLTVLLTIDRYIVVCKPLHAQSFCTVNRVYKQVAILVIAALVFSIPRYFEHESADNIFGFQQNTELHTDFYTISYKIILFFLSMYLIPMIVMVILNCKLLLALRHRTNMPILSLREKAQIPARRGITAAVVVVVVATVLCNMVAMVAHLLWSLEVKFFPHSAELSTARRYTSLVSNLMLTINSAINFIIYFLCSRNFRTLMRRTLLCLDLSDYLGRRRRSRLDSLSVGCNTSPRTSASGSAVSLQLTSVKRISLTP